MEKKLKESAGFNKEELVQFIKNKLPSFVNVIVEEKETHFSIKLKWEPNFWIEGGIFKSKYPENIPNEEEILRRIRFKAEKEIDDIIASFSISRVEEILTCFKLKEYYEEKYRDKNVLYKVKKLMEIEPHYTTNLESYYDTKAKEIVPFFDPLWQALIKEIIKHANIQEMIDYIHGANERIKQLLLASDIIREILRQNPANNDTEFTVNFHIFHFLSLVKSLSDNLAWIIKLYCQFNLDEKKTDLTLKSFQDCLMNNNKKLYDTIFGKAHTNDLDAIKNFRDIIHHKHALYVDRVRIGFNGPVKIMMQIEPKSDLLINGRRYRETISPKLAEASDKDSIAKYGLKKFHVYVGSPIDMPWRDPIDFTQKCIALIGELYNSTYERILLELKRKPIGKVSKYFQEINVAVIALTEKIQAGDKILIEGSTTFLTQQATSMQIDKKEIEFAEAGQEIGLKVNSRVREGDEVYKMTS